MMILLCYDASPDATAAIKRAGELFAGAPATVLSIWQPVVDVLAPGPAGFGFGSGFVDVTALDDASAKNAAQRADEGVRRAVEAGLEARPRACGQQGTIADTILLEADAVGASVIVMGSRGLTGLKSMLLGSVSHSVIQHADRPVVVVPSPEVAAARARERRAARGSE